MRTLLVLILGIFCSVGLAKVAVVDTPAPSGPSQDHISETIDVAEIVDKKEDADEGRPSNRVRANSAVRNLHDKQPLGDLHGRMNPQLRAGLRYDGYDSQENHNDVVRNSNVPDTSGEPEPFDLDEGSQEHGPPMEQPPVNRVSRPFRRPGGYAGGHGGYYGGGGYSPAGGGGGGYSPGGYYGGGGYGGGGHRPSRPNRGHRGGNRGPRGNKKRPGKRPGPAGGGQPKPEQVAPQEPEIYEPTTMDQERPQQQSQDLQEPRPNRGQGGGKRRPQRNKKRPGKRPGPNGEQPPPEEVAPQEPAPAQEEIYEPTMDQETPQQQPQDLQEPAVV